VGDVLGALGLELFYEPLLLFRNALGESTLQQLVSADKMSQNSLLHDSTTCQCIEELAFT
jgi:hypothetical protein